MSDKLVFIDRDGTINSDKGYVHQIQDFEFLPGSLKALQLLTKKNILIYIVTNQAGIAKGYFTEDDFHKLTIEVLKIFKANSVKIEGVLYCPHHPEATVPAYRNFCSCRKPANGLLKKVIDNQSFQIKNMALIGDKNSDIEAGNSLGMRTYLVETGYGATEKLETKATHVMPDLKSSVSHLLKIWGLT